MFDTTAYERRMQTAIDHYDQETKKIQTGRASTAMLDSVMVSAYGTNLPLNQVATVSVPESQLIQVSPFDPSTIQAITAAIRADQSLGFNPVDDGRIIRVPVPQLTEERRQQIVKQLQGKAEDARVVLRGVRQDGLKDIKAKKTNKEISEDDAKRFEKTFDQLMSDHNAKIDSMTKAKETEIMTI